MTTDTDAPPDGWTCTHCGDIDDPSTRGRLSTGDLVCWRCAERAGEFTVPPEFDWR